MVERWPDYARFPASGTDFERYVATVFLDLGYQVQATPATNDYGADLIVEEPLNGRRIAVQAKFYNHASLGNTPVQEVIGSLSHWNADEGWVVTNGRFSKNAKTLAEENGVTLIDNDGLNRLIRQAKESPMAGAALRSNPFCDLSGFDTLVEAPTQAVHYKVPNESAQASTSQTRFEASVTAPPRTFNMQDVMIRWNCTRGYINKEIARGLPMRKLSNGRWSISEEDLLGWERLLAEERKREARNSLIKTIVGVIALLACLSALLALVSPGGLGFAGL